MSWSHYEARPLTASRTMMTFYSPIGDELIRMDVSRSYADFLLRGPLTKTEVLDPVLEVSLNF